MHNTEQMNSVRALWVLAGAPSRACHVSYIEVLKFPHYIIVVLLKASEEVAACHHFL